MSSPARSANRVLMGAGDFTFVQDWARCVAAFADVELAHDVPTPAATARGFTWSHAARRSWRPSRLMQPFNRAHDASAIIDLVAESSRNVLHSHFYSDAERFVVASKRTGLPLVHTEHSSGLQTGAFSSTGLRSLRRVSAAASVFIAVSDSLRDALRGLGIQRSIEVVPNPLDDDWFRRPLTASTNDATTYVSVGWLEPRKDHSTLIEAFNTLHRSSPDSRLRIIGDGPERKGLERQIKETGLERHVTLVGRRDRAGTQEELLAADVYVHTSRSETFGVAMVEAWACGLPVIALPCGGVSSLADTIGGASLTSRSSADLARTMHDYSRRASLDECTEIRQRAQGRFSVARVASSLEALYPDA